MTIMDKFFFHIITYNFIREFVHYSFIVICIVNVIVNCYFYIGSVVCTCTIKRSISITVLVSNTVIDLLIVSAQYS